MILGSVIPFIIILGSNIIIIIKIKMASAQRSKMRANEGQCENKSKEKHLTRMLIFVSLAYVVTSAPLRLYYLLMDIPEIGGPEVYDLSNTYWSLRYHTQMFLLADIFVFNHAINFYLYCLGGGAKYRKDAAEVCKRICLCRRKY